MRRRLIQVLLLVSVVFSPALYAAADVDSKRKELEEIQQRIRHLQHDLKLIKGQRQALHAGLRDAEKRIANAARVVRRLRKQIARQQKRLERLKTARRQTQERVATQRQALARQIRAAYAMGRQERIKLLLNQQEPGVVSRMLIDYDYLNRARSRRLVRLKQELARLGEIEEEILAENSRLKSLEKERRQEHKHFLRSREERKRLLATLNADIRSKGDRLDELKRDEKRLQRLIDKLRETLADLPVTVKESLPFRKRAGRLQWPVKGRLAIRYGAPRKLGKLRWEGVFIAAPEGREVKAVHHGRVAFADWLRGYGLLMIIDHGDGYMTLYGHNQVLFKETGEWVEPGETIALVGESGGHSRSGVYFGIRYKGKPVNPVRWCRKPGRGGAVGSRINGADTGKVGLNPLACEAVVKDKPLPAPCHAFYTFIPPMNTDFNPPGLITWAPSRSQRAETKG